MRMDAGCPEESFTKAARSFRLIGRVRRLWPFGVIRDEHGRQSMEIKSDDQLDMQSLHRVRDRWVGRRMSVINQIRALLWSAGSRSGRAANMSKHLCPASWKIRRTAPPSPAPRSRPTRDPG